MGRRSGPEHGQPILRRITQGGREDPGWGGLRSQEVKALKTEPSLHLPLDNPERISKEVAAALQNPTPEAVPTSAQIQAARLCRRAQLHQAFPAGGDKVDFSPLARALAQIRQLPEVRLHKVQAVRQAIARGQYEDPRKLKIAITRLLEELAPELIP